MAHQQHFNPQNLPLIQRRLMMHTAAPPNQPGMPQAMKLAQKNPVEDLRTAFQNLVIPLLTASDSVVSNSAAQDELKQTVEHSFQNFMTTAKTLEADFVKKRATIAKQQPELVIQEENDDIRHEIKRIDELIRKHSNQLKEWSQSLEKIQQTNEPVTSNPVTSNVPMQQNQMNMQQMPQMQTMPQIKQQPMM